ncbi:hypothetical protein [Mucilaginibacter pedocola]|uniref:DUF5666 domain-containing protein n=1 Tax=Mucilaginibacter pedocola TaxID=1792845 RepID=A0A1S9PFE2_9SPHI|nr:hypothetical protein [Mucilaginibacter pedocola]OOQ59683.1 hypothetical protein BC343_05830 [Mucilaginibacter pedocola]
MKKRNIARAILLVAFAAFVIHEFTDDTPDPNNKFLKNKVVFSGHVLSTKVSGNHAFGVMLLQVDSSNVESFTDTLKKGIYPYKIKDGKAELYVRVHDIDKGDVVKVISDSLAYYYVNKHEKLVGDLGVITYNGDIEFAKENSILSNNSGIYQGRS